ncbi:MAG: glycosyltransferase family 39 protein [Chloroflexi bacterium]|nr:glycosyltransferase family 39 protein [Chloroflexota bacterium]
MRRFHWHRLRHWIQPSYGLLIAILLLGIFLRTFQFPNNPPGLFVDEAGAGYETFSLLRTGADRWGVTWPVYFISWGSGQSVLYSYLSIPIVAALGLDRLSVRLLSLFVGILTLPLLYVTVKRTAGTSAALIATLLLAIMPWHVMISRWALDANLLPFFMLLGTYTVERALTSQSPKWVWIALLPWGLALYAYAMAYVVVPILLLLVLAFYRRAILANWKAWLGALALYVLLAMPIALFLVKNWIVQDVLPVEPWLPFGIPLVPISRLAQVSSPLPERLLLNLFFIVSGFQDGEVRNSVLGIAPAFIVTFPLAIVGAARFIKDRRADLFLLWLAACLPLFFIADPAINRINAIFVPMLVVAVYGFAELRRRLYVSRRILTTAVGALVMLQALVFVADYFLVYPTVPDVELAFFKGLDRAVSRGLAVAGPSEPILVTDRIVLPEILTAFYSNYAPSDYQRELRYTVEYGAIIVKSFGRFYFGLDNLPNPSAPFTYILGKWDDDPCAKPQASLETRLWQVGRCRAE